MKTIRLSLVAVLLASAFTVGAQQRHAHRATRETPPTVYVMSHSETDSLYGKNSLTSRQCAKQNNQAVCDATTDYRQTMPKGNRNDCSMPRCIFANKKNTFSFAFGGYLALRTSYSFDGTTNNMNMVPYDIPIPGNYATNEKIEMDATTSRLYGKAIANTRALGRVVIFINGDFTGGAENSYTPSLRSFYVSFLGLTMGRDITTFSDDASAPRTIDFRGPNALADWKFAAMIRYEYPFCRNHLTVGAAAEMPYVSGTYDEQFAPVPQRMPDFPVYFQYAWGAKRENHIRASAVLRNMYMYNQATSSTTSLFGWGVQFSGRINVVRPLHLYFNGIYGEGITPYIQDLYGSGLDFTPNPANPDQIQTMPMYGWQAALQLNLMKNLTLSGGYSDVRICKKNGFFGDNQYKEGQYIFGNIFWNIAPRFTLAAEYIYGSRKNMDLNKNHSNRASLLMQYNF